MHAGKNLEKKDFLGIFLIEGLGNFQETIVKKEQQNLNVDIFHRFQVPSVTWPCEPKNMHNRQKCPIGRLGVKRKLGK